MLLLCFSLWSCSTDQAPKKSTVASSEASATQDQPTTNSNKKTILFFGDSLTAGYGLDEEQSFPSLIEDKIDSLALDYKVVNAGLSGETTSGV